MILWLAILGAWTVSFLFAGLEAGLLSVDSVRLRSHVKQRTPGAARLDRHELGKHSRPVAADEIAGRLI